MRTKTVTKYPDGQEMTAPLFIAEGMLIECQDLSKVLGYHEIEACYEYTRTLRIDRYRIETADHRHGLIQRIENGWCLIVNSEYVPENIQELIHSLGRKVVSSKKEEALNV